MSAGNPAAVFFSPSATYADPDYELMTTPMPPGVRFYRLLGRNAGCGLELATP